MARIRKTLLTGVLLVLMPVAPAQRWEVPDFVADTLLITISLDSTQAETDSLPQVVDNRKTGGAVVGIRQIKRWFLIPVDQYFVLAEPLSGILCRYLAGTLPETGETLVIDHLSIWFDSRPAFAKSWMVNGYTRIEDKDGKTVRDWQWELRLKKPRKKKIEAVVGQLITDWMIAQKNALGESTAGAQISPYRYRREFILWTDWIFFGDGYALDARLSLDFPSDRIGSHIRGVPGIYYRKSSLHESIAIGGSDQQWYHRFNPTWLGRFDITQRFGFNSFNPQRFDFLDWWNLFMINVGFSASVEYRPIYLKGLFAGLGLHQSVNILPEVIARFETGVLLTVGIALP